MASSDVSVKSNVKAKNRPREKKAKPLSGKTKKKRGYEGRRIDTYRAWKNMLARCLNPEHHGYPSYGGRGIKVYEPWIPIQGDRESHKACFARFCSAVGIRPSASVSIDRIDVNGNYEPGNVRWATKAIQGINKRTTIILEYPTTKQPIAAAALAKELGMKYNALRYQLMKEGKWPDV